MKFFSLTILKFTGLLIGAVFVFFFLQAQSPMIPMHEISPATSQTVATSSLAVDTIPQPQSSLQSIVAFGDSITAGYGISMNEAYPKRLEEALVAQGMNVRVINSGVAGETTAGGLRRAPSIAAQNPDFVIIALGGNDVLRGINPESVKENLAGIVNIFQKVDSIVILAGMKAPTNLGPVYAQAFDRLYADLAAEHRLGLVPFLLEDVALVSSLNQADGIHPNQKGAVIIAENNILPVILPLLKKEE